MIANLHRFVSLRDWVYESFELVKMPWRPAANSSKQSNTIHQPIVFVKLAETRRIKFPRQPRPIVQGKSKRAAILESS